ncbi:MAG: hypothetical protein H6713_16975 [Myxococcales bacterium]|nr:hypothetical protein [Myxococcales bacterium]
MRARWIGLIAVGLFASGLLGWALPAVSPGVLAVFWAHVVLGALACAGLVVYTPLHLRRVAKTRAAAARVSGWILLALACGGALSGVAALVPELTLERSLGAGGVAALRVSHFAFGGGLLALLWTHRMQAPKDVPGLAEIAASLLLVLGVVGWAGAARRGPSERGGAQSPVDPASALRVADAAAPAVELLAETTRCADCHPAIVAQWEASAHRFASFANPFYLHALRTLDGLRGREATKFCAACHDPLPLLAGVFDSGAPLADSLPWADRGVTCLVCHAAVHGGDGGGNGDFTLATPTPLWPGVASPAPASGLAQLLVRARPDAHVARLGGAAALGDALCGTCHEVALPAEITAYRFLPGFNDFDAWQGSPFSHEIALPLGQADPETCRSCHMRRVPADDPAARGGTVLDHRFAAANLALAQHNHDERWLARARDGLAEAGASAVPIAASTGEYQGLLYGEGATLPTGAELVIHALVRATGVGHDFPGGTVDSHETWVELEVVDASGRTLARHGAPLEDGGPPPDAHVLRARPLDEDGAPITERDAFRSRTVLYRHLAPAGAGEVVRYALTIPNDARGPVTITTRLWFRKFAREFIAAVYRGRGEPAPPQERVLLGERAVTVALAERPQARACSPASPWDEVLRFISGATRVGEYALALAAAERARASAASGRRRRSSARGRCSPRVDPRRRSPSCGLCSSRRRSAPGCGWWPRARRRRWATTRPRSRACVRWPKSSRATARFTACARGWPFGPVSPRRRSRRPRPRSRSSRATSRPATSRCSPPPSSGAASSSAPLASATRRFARTRPSAS